MHMGPTLRHDEQSQPIAIWFRGASRLGRDSARQHSEASLQGIAATMVFGALQGVPARPMPRPPAFPPPPALLRGASAPPGLRGGLVPPPPPPPVRPRELPPWRRADTAAPPAMPMATWPPQPAAAPPAPAQHPEDTDTAWFDKELREAEHLAELKAMRAAQKLFLEEARALAAERQSLESERKRPRVTVVVKDEEEKKGDDDAIADDDKTPSPTTTISAATHNTEDILNMLRLVQETEERDSSPSPTRPTPGTTLAKKEPLDEAERKRRRKETRVRGGRLVQERRLRLALQMLGVDPAASSSSSVGKGKGNKRNKGKGGN